MNILNKSAEKVQRICTTPQRIRMVQSIKKSIHRSIQKINPTQYKNILKGQCIYMHLCHKGQIVNSEYTKVALFMGATVFKKAVEKITVIVTNEPSNKAVKKLASMGKPILSVLWLEACFQEKRKVEHEGFLFQSQKENSNEQQKQQQNSFNFEALLSLYQPMIESIYQIFERKCNTKFLKFVDKKQKTQKIKQKIIPPHEIDIGFYQGNRRKSQVNSDKVNKKRTEKRKIQIQSEGAQKQKEDEQQKIEKIKKIQEDVEGTEEQTNCIEEKENKQKFNKRIYQKYLKDFKNYEDRVKGQGAEELTINIEEEQTPCFANHMIQAVKQTKNESRAATPTKTKNSTVDQEQFLQTCSIKRQNPKNIRINFIQPLISQKIQKINMKRQQHHLPLFQMAGDDTRNNICVISQQSKVEVILALLSKPKIIVSEKFIMELEENPTIDITQEFTRKFEVNCRLNRSKIVGKKIVLLDSVLGNSSLTKIIKQCNAEALGLSDYLFCKIGLDIVITNKKMYMKSERENYRVLSEASFIDQLISFERQRK